MKKYVLLVIFTISINTAYSQVFGMFAYNKDATDALSNRSDLDPIEGVWSVEEIRRGWNNYHTFPDAVKDKQVCIIKYSKGSLNQGQFYFEKLGDTNAYIYHFSLTNSSGNDYWYTPRVFVSNNQFSSIVEMPISADFVGSRAQFIQNFLKINSGKF